MPRYDYLCPVCGVREYMHGVNETLLLCPLERYDPIGRTCNQPLTRLVPTGVGFECRRLTSEVSPRHQHWLDTEGQRRLALPDGHPEKLEPISKSSDQMHGDGGPKVPPKEPVARQEERIAGHVQEWLHGPGGGPAKVAELVDAGKI